MEPISEYELDNICNRVVLHYFQSWGQSAEDRAKDIGDAASLAGVEVIFENENGQMIPKYPQGSNWPEFRNDIERCFPLGQFELESEAVKAVILKYSQIK